MSREWLENTSKTKITVKCAKMPHINYESSMWGNKIRDQWRAITKLYVKLHLSVILRCYLEYTLYIVW